ncbi:lipoprotein [Allostella vacuolata]|nr:lipoprotein [Stella vacuolata]
MVRMRLVLGLLATAGAPLIAGTTTRAADLVAITDHGEFLQFSSGNPRETIRRDLQGMGLPLVGIDVRTADGQLYGIDRGGAIHRIDAGTAIAIFQARLSVALVPAESYLVDFDPVADRLRVIGAGGQNLLVDVDTGIAAVHSPVRHAAGVPAARIAAGAYSHTAGGAASRRLHLFDGASGTYGLLDPPEDGIVRPISQSPGRSADAADIASHGGRDQGYAAINNILHVFDVATGRASAIQAIGTGATGRAGRIIDIAVLPPIR